MFFVSTIFIVLFSQSLQSVLPREDTPGRDALLNFPLIDGHNDLPYNLYNNLQNKIYNFSFDRNLTNDELFGSAACETCHTDLPRMKQGQVGAQFWAAYVSCDPLQYNTTVSRSFEQIDVIKRFISHYPDDLEFVTTSRGILEAFNASKIGSLIGLEGGHSIDDKMSLLRLFYDLGVRYMTLTHSCNLNWADASPIDDMNNTKIDLTDFGKNIVREMNRLGMIIDLSHVSHNVMLDVLEVSAAPVIFSHSSAYTIFKHHRNVQDDVLARVRATESVVMVNFYSEFIAENATIVDVVEHIEHIANVSGVDYVGIGSDYDGVPLVPAGLEDVSKFPDLFDLLKSTNPERWTIENLEKLAGRNVFRVFEKVEEVRDSLQNDLPEESRIPIQDINTENQNTNNTATSTLSTMVMVFIIFLMIFV